MTINTQTNVIIPLIFFQDQTTNTEEIVDFSGGILEIYCSGIFDGANLFFSIQPFSLVGFPELNGTFYPYAQNNKIVKITTEGQQVYLKTLGNAQIKCTLENASTNTNITCIGGHRPDILITNYCSILSF